MAKNELENDSSLVPKSEEREDSGLQDLLSVAAKIKDTPDDEPAAAASDESGVITFTAGDLGGEDQADESDAVFGSFSGGLGLGLEAEAEPSSSPDLTPLGGEGSVKETSAAPAPSDELTRRPEGRRSPFIPAVVVLGLGLAVAITVLVINKPKPEMPAAPERQVAQAEMSANNEAAAVGKVEADEPAGASAGQALAPEPEAEPEPESPDEGEAEAPEGEAALLEGEDAGALLAAEGSDPGDPMAEKAGLLEGSGKKSTSKTGGKWDQGKVISNSKGSADAPAPAPEPEPEPAVKPKPEPEPEPVKPPSGSGKSSSDDDEVDCLLNPDLPKCNKGSAPKPKEEQVLVPKLPESLSQAQLRDGFNSAKSKAKACGTKFGAPAGTKVRVHVSIEGASGKVSSVSAKGEHAGTELGKCVEDAVKGASFSKFQKPSQGVDYSMIM